jgi:glycoprotein 3-alpha-L-fucosyltransferase
MGVGVDKLEALQKYKFSLAFENSNVEDYVTEKFFQALVAGTVLENLCREFEN